MKARIVVKLKAGVLDPQGQAILRALRQMGRRQVSGVRQGKVFELDFELEDRAEVERLSRDIAREILSNPLIEEFEVQEIQ